MSDLEKLRTWISACPSVQRLGGFWIDYYTPAPDNGGIAPSGLVEISRKTDILGNVTVENQYNFALYFILAKAPEDDTGAADNAEIIMALQTWVQEQSARHKAPTFGDKPETERIQAQNGALYAADEEGTAIYTVQLSVNFTKIYEGEDNPWVLQ